MVTPIPWYRTTWFIVLALVLLFPLGLYLVWTRRPSWGLRTNWIVTGVVAAAVVLTAIDLAASPSSKPNPSPVVGLVAPTSTPTNVQTSAPTHPPTAVPTAVPTPKLVAQRARSTSPQSSASGKTLPSGLCDGVTNRYTDIQNALDAAATSPGNIVTLSAGVCLVNGTLRMRGTYPVTLSGAGPLLTTLHETGSFSLVAASNNGSVVDQIGLDASGTNCGCNAFETSADNTQLRSAKLMGGTGYNSIGTAAFTAYYGGDFSKSGRGYAIGNVMSNVIDVDQDCDDGISFSYQHNASITGLSQTGSRLALYRDVGVSVNGDHYTPGGCTKAQHGIWLTPPSRNITISNFVSTGFGGRFCPNSVGTCSSISINGELAAGGMVIGNISGVSVQHSTFGGWLEVNVTYPGFTTTGSWSTSSAAKTVCSGSVSVSGITC